ncbi:hypothetical protein Q0M39_13780, partial [Staphylococcus aureus]|nr:hypothetical protein [Staphylococcus aureus]
QMTKYKPPKTIKNIHRQLWKHVTKIKMTNLDNEGNREYHNIKKKNIQEKKIKLIKKHTNITL